MGFVVPLLPIKIPHAESLAKEATYYLISIANGDKSGEEITAEGEILLEMTIEEEGITVSAIEEVSE